MTPWRSWARPTSRTVPWPSVSLPTSRSWRHCGRSRTNFSGSSAVSNERLFQPRMSCAVSLKTPSVRPHQCRPTLRSRSPPRRRMTFLHFSLPSVVPTIFMKDTCRCGPSTTWRRARQSSMTWRFFPFQKGLLRKNLERKLQRPSWLYHSSRRSTSLLHGPGSLAKWPNGLEPGTNWPGTTFSSASVICRR